MSGFRSGIDAGALRRSEWVGLDVGHVTWTEEGMRLLIVRSKTDKEGAGAEIGIAHGRSPATCPVAALRHWLEQAELLSRPVFRKVDRWSRVHAGRLDPDGVRQILKRRAAGATSPARPVQQASSGYKGEEAASVMRVVPQAHDGRPGSMQRVLVERIVRRSDPSWLV